MKNENHPFVTSSTKPKISIGSLGGTICMKSSAEGIVPTLGVEDFLVAIPALSDIATLRAKDLFHLPSEHLKFEMLLEAIAWAREEVENGADGVVFTQGTDTLEESAFLCDLLWDKTEPLVLCGAMRSAGELGSDGLRNLYSATLCASSSQSHHRGALVVMNDRIHLAKWVRKSHSFSLDAFTSDGKDCGEIVENKVRYFHPYPKNRLYFPIPKTVAKKVFLFEHTLSDDDRVLEWVNENQSGLVICGYGAGHLSLEAAHQLDALSIPVVVCTRTTSGSAAYHTYGTIGGEIDIQKRGGIMGGYLSGRKARILLWVILNNDLDMKLFNAYLEKMTL